MAFEKHLSELQDMITKFLEIHANPYDTSKHNAKAEKLDELQKALTQTKTTKKPELENNDCEEKFARIKAFYNRSDISPFFPDFNSIGEEKASESQTNIGGVKSGSSINGDSQVSFYWNPSPKPTDKPDLILYANHAYSLQGISNNKFQIRNPHGLSSDPQKETLFELSAVQLVKLFDAVVIVK